MEMPTRASTGIETDPNVFYREGREFFMVRENGVVRVYRFRLTDSDTGAEFGLKGELRDIWEGETKILFQIMRSVQRQAVRDAGRKEMKAWYKREVTS
jgi:hypothetical protein